MVKILKTAKDIKKALDNHCLVYCDHGSVIKDKIGQYLISTNTENGSDDSVFMPLESSVWGLMSKNFKILGDNAYSFNELTKKELKAQKLKYKGFEFKGGSIF